MSAHGVLEYVLKEVEVDEVKIVSSNARHAKVPRHMGPM